MANLLQKASIVLTPTAYDDGKVLCAKPSEPPYGDFDFSRNSAATRVNAQGLVENVQILSSNLVQNGDFSEEGAEEVSNGSFSQEGVQLVTNGDFSSDSNWTKQASWSISGGAANYDFLSDAKYIRQTLLNGGFVAGKTYKINFEITSGTAYMNVNSNGGGLISLNTYSVGSYSIYVTASASGSDLLIYGRNTSGTAFSIDNVSVREVAQNWTLGTGWSIGEDKASSDGSQTSNSSLFQPNVLTQNKYYKFEFTLSNVTSGAVRLRNGIGDSETYISYQNSNGTYTAYSIVNSSNKTLVVDADSSFNGSITNISVKEVGQNWTLGDGWSIGDGVSVATSGAASKLTQSISGLSGKKCSVTFTLSNYGGNGTIKLDFGSVVGQNINANGTYTEVGTYDIDRLEFFKNSSFSGSITNISVIEITTDTNLPRINYEGFSYQDALGSELVTNGDFSSNTDWFFIGDTIIQNGVAEFPTSTNSFLIQSNVVALSVKTYKLQYEVITTNGNNLRLIGGSSAFGAVALDSATIGVKTIYIVSNGTNVNLQFNNDNFIGSIDNVSLKEYLGQEVVPNSGCGSWLWEPQSTNLITQSELFSDAYWTKIGTSVTNGFTSPNGTNNACKLVEDTSDGSHAFYNSNFSSLNGQSYTYSLFVKYNGRQWFRLWGQYGNSNFSAYFDIQNGLLGSKDIGMTSKIEYYGNGWYRISATATTDGTASRFRGYLAEADNDPFYQGDGTSGVYIWGAQVEQQSYATSYIPTSGSQVTRNQDLCTNGGSLASINSTEGVLYAEVAALADTITDRHIVSISDGTTSNRVYIGFGNASNLIEGRSRIAGVNAGFTDFVVSDETEFHKIAYKWKLNDYSLWVDGVEVDTSTGAVASANTLNTLNFNNGVGANIAEGKVKALAVWKEALSDQELADLTYPTPTDPTFALNFDTIATDFTFARGSEATYVDAQGLIQSTNELGEELVVNGDFSSPTTIGWSDNYLCPFSVENNMLKVTAQETGSGMTYQINGLTIGSKYVVSWDYINGSGALPKWRVTNSDQSALKTYSDNSNYYYFIPTATTASFSPLYQCGTAGTFFFDNVSVKEVITATNTPRLDYSTGAEAFLLEPQSTNLIPYSEDFSQSSWDNSNISEELSSVLSPDGTSYSYKLTNDAVTGNHFLRDIITVTSGEVYTLSLFIKKGTRDIVSIADGFTVNVLANFDLTNGTVTNVSATSSSIESFNNGWYRCMATITPSASTLGLMIFSGTNYAGMDEGGYFYIWGAQLEQQSYATSYIPTAGTTVTRNQETCINATPEINSEEGVLYAEISALALAGGDSRISLSNGTLNNRVTFAYSPNPSKAYIIIKMNGISVINDLNLEIGNHLENKKIAISYKSGDTKVFLNGTEIKASTILFSGATLNDLSFESANNSVDFFGNTKDLQVYTKALSDAELIKLTT